MKEVSCFTAVFAFIAVCSFFSCCRRLLSPFKVYMSMTDKRVTMIKPVVGKVRSPAYALPENDFVYGIESKMDKEGAGEGERNTR